MKTKRSLSLAIGAMLMAMLACSGPGEVAPTPDLTALFAAALTEAAGTLQSFDATLGTPTNTPTAPATFTNTDLPTNTSVPPTATLTATATPTNTNTPAGPTTITLNPGSQGGIYTPGTVIEFPLAGDDASDRSYQGFVTFNLRGIPSGATIAAVKLDLTPFDAGGSTFPLGCMRVYQQNYGTLDAGDFFTGTAQGALWRFCNVEDLTSASAQSITSSGIATFQASLASGQFQIRLQFNEQATNNDGWQDRLNSTPKLIITYTGP